METYMELYRCLPLRAAVITDRREFRRAGGIHGTGEPSGTDLPRSGKFPRVCFQRKTLFVTSIEVLSEQ